MRDMEAIVMMVVVCLVLIGVAFAIGSIVQKAKQDAEWNKSLSSAVKASELAAESKYSARLAEAKRQWEQEYAERHASSVDDDGSDGEDKGDETEEEEESTSVGWVRPYYHCDSCGNDFRIDPSKTVKICPFCEADMVMDDPSDSDAEEDSYRYRCPHCNREFQFRDEDDPYICPYCGGERNGNDWNVYTGELALLKGYWICPSCGQEFRLDNEKDIPKFCPTCEMEFKPGEQEQPDDDIPAGTYKCTACGEQVDVFHFSTPSHCPCCGRSGTMREVEDQN